MRTLVRSLLSTPRLTLPALACIVLGVGAAQLVAALAYTVLYRSPALPHAERLVRVWLHAGTARIEQGGISYLEYRDLLGLPSFDRVEAAARTRIAVRTAAGSERLRAEAVSSGYFELVGVRPALGRAFTPAEHRAGAAVALIGHALWQRRFGGDPGVVGRRLVVRGRGPAPPEVPYTIVGVLPPRFVGSVDPDVSELWVPLAASPLRAMFLDREARNVWVLARLAVGRSPAEARAAAQAELAALGRRLAAAQPAVYAGHRWSVERFGESWREPLRPGLLTLLGAAALLLLIACANVAHLLLARLARRENELALRLAIGASRGSLLRRLALEALVLAIAGGALGTLLAQVAVRRLAGDAALELPSYVPFGLDARLLLLSLVMVLATALLFGVLPAAVGAAVDPRRWRAGRGLTLAARHRRLDRLLVTSEFAVTLVLVVVGGLLLRSYLALASGDVGFRTDHLLRLAITLDPVEHPDAPSVLAFAERAREAVRRQPGVRAVGLMSEVLPPWFDDTFAVVHDGARDPELAEVARHAVDRDLLRVLDIAIVAGRPFGTEDRAGAPPVALLSASLARRLVGAGEESAVQRAVGRRVQLLLEPESGTLSPPLEVVGVVEDVRYHGPLGSRRAPHDLYVPFEQVPSHVVSFAVHTTVPPETLAGPLQRAIGRLSPVSPTHWISTMEEELQAQLAGARFYGRLAGVYGASAALLALLGVYGVMANVVARRRGELAVRAAVGAGRRQLLRLVLGEAGRVLLAGLALGAAAALAASHALRGLLHGIAPSDPATYFVAAAALLMLGLLASYLPARRAAATDPARVLRGEP